MDETGANRQDDAVTKCSIPAASTNLDLEFGYEDSENIRRFREAARQRDGAGAGEGAGPEPAPARRRLPIYGENEIDAALRVASDDPAFGHWLSTHYDRGILDLAWELDNHENVSFISVSEADRIYNELRAWRCSDPECDGEHEPDEPHEDLIALDDLCYLETRDEWLAIAVGKQLRRRIDPIAEFVVSSAHSCFGGVAGPIEPPASAGVYCVEGVPGWVKIGKAKNIAKRIRDLQIGSPVPLRLVAVLSQDTADEGKLHHRWRHLRSSGEWFRLDNELAAFVREARAALPAREAAS